MAKHIHIRPCICHWTLGFQTGHHLFLGPWVCCYMHLESSQAAGQGVRLHTGEDLILAHNSGPRSRGIDAFLAGRVPRQHGASRWDVDHTRPWLHHLGHSIWLSAAGKDPHAAHPQSSILTQFQCHPHYPCQLCLWELTSKPCTIGLSPMTQSWKAFSNAFKAFEMSL